MTLSAVDCISRGLVNLRANWELVPVQFLQVFLVTVLFVVGLLPPLAVLGWSSLDLLAGGIEELDAAVASLSSFLARGSEAWLLMLIALLVTCLIWLIGMLVYSYFQSGIYGVLRAGDRQAPADKAAAWHWFRTFSTADLRGFAARYLWRYFWFFNLVLLVSSLLLLLPVGLLILAVWGEATFGLPAAIGIGCGGLIPLVFGLVVAGFWAALAQADLPHEDSGVWVALRRALGVVGRRLGTLLLLAVIGIGLTVAIAIGMAVVSFGLGLLSGSSPGLQTALSLLMTLFEWVISSVFSVAFAAVLIALMRSETLEGSPS